MANNTVNCINNLSLIFITAPFIDVLWFFEGIAHSNNRMDQLLLKPLVYFTTQVIDVHINEVGSPVEINAPDHFSDLCSRQYPVLMDHQHFQ